MTHIRNRCAWYRADTRRMTSRYLGDAIRIARGLCLLNKRLRHGKRKLSFKVPQ